MIINLLYVTDIFEIEKKILFTYVLYILYNLFIITYSIRILSVKLNLLQSE